jgi:Uma2 family endonuclease
MQGCTQMDLDIYPPPDLAIESDVTSKTTLEIYAAIGVPEVWIYSQQQLKIYLIKGTNYQENSSSLSFPNLSLTTLIPQLVEQAIHQGTSQMLRTLKNQIQSNA